MPIDKVIFRRWRDSPHSVIALFPYEPAGLSFVNSYEHVGQHGGADYYAVLQHTTPAPATDPEVVGLMAELTARGYNLKVVKRYYRR